MQLKGCTSCLLFIIMVFRTSADNESTGNSTNLALKGIIAIKAMSELASALGQSSDASSYSVRLFHPPSLAFHSEIPLSPEYRIELYQHLVFPRHLKLELPLTFLRQLRLLQLWVQHVRRSMAGHQPRLLYYSLRPDQFHRVRIHRLVEVRTRR